MIESKVVHTTSIRHACNGKQYENHSKHFFIRTMNVLEEIKMIENIIPLLTAQQVAKILNISPASVYKLMSTSQIPTVRIGRSVRVRLEDLAEYIGLNVHK